MPKSLIAVFVALSLCTPVHAHAAGDVPALSVGLVQEKDAALFFGYLRDSVSAAAEGRAAEPPPELVQRAQAIGEEMKRRGAAAAHALIDALESSVRQQLREPTPLPAPPPGHIRL